MTQWDRRSFLHHSAATFFTACAKPALGVAAPSKNLRITSKGDTLLVEAASYIFTYSRKDDVFTVLDARGLQIAEAPLQPVVVVLSVTDAAVQIFNPGLAAQPEVSGQRVTFVYDNVNGGSRLTLSVRFDDAGFWFEPLIYRSSRTEDIVSLHYFTSVTDHIRTPALRAGYTTTPGIAEGEAISPVQVSSLDHEQTMALGHSGFYVPPFTEQQWGLPVHYFCAMSAHTPGAGLRDTFVTGRSDTLVCGLADLPNGDLLFDFHGRRTSLWIDYRSDLWHHLRTPGELALGATLCWAFGKDQYGAISSYYNRLLDASVIHRKQNSAAKNAVVLAPQYCTWGAQVDRGKHQLTDSFLEELYGQMKAAGMKAKTFSIDDKWEEHYGKLEHSHERLPQFEQFLDRVRAEGHHIGMWAAFLRCENPADLGLEAKHMLQQPDGTPHRENGGAYYILDLTRPEVAKVLSERVRSFVRRYKPALVKFDFGYEIPAVRTAAPFDKTQAGERILRYSLEIIVKALRQENPDIAIMYYQLSPLFVEYFDLHSTDDTYLSPGDYDWEVNRRIYFASPLAQLGIPVYGSSGYDWSSSPAIWFDSVASGTIGSLNDFQGDEFGDTSTSERVALYNGLAQTVRPTSLFTVVPFPRARPEAAIRGARTRSWARIEDGKVTLIAARPPSFDDGDSVDYRLIDPRVNGLLTSTVPMVVASKTNESIAESNHLAVVACGEGRFSLSRRKGRIAQITTHSFEGVTTQSTIPIKNNELNLAISRRDHNDTPIEWLEIRIT